MTYIYFRYLSTGDSFRSIDISYRRLTYGTSPTAWERSISRVHQQGPSAGSMYADQSTLADCCLPGRPLTNEMFLQALSFVFNSAQTRRSVPRHAAGACRVYTRRSHCKQFKKYAGRYKKLHHLTGQKRNQDRTD